MEKLTKISIKVLIIFLLLIVINICNKVSYAENETNSSNANTSNTTSTSNTTNSTSTTTSTGKKSSNANLKNLGIKPHDFSGFKPGTTTYNVTVPSDTETIEVYATAQNAKATITGTGTKELKKGENNIDIVVTAENGNTKTYTINVTREGIEENTENTEAVQQRYSGDGLASLEIENVQLSPNFDTNIYQYTLKYIGENTTLDIKATATDPYYTVEITGNENLQDGENIINILVYDPDENNVATYQLTVNKSLIDEEKIAKEKEEQQRTNIIIGCVGVAIVVLIIFIIIIHRRNKYLYDEEDEEDEEDYKDIDNNKDDEEYINIENYENKEDNKEIENDEYDGELKLTKEQARENFLNNYSNNDMYEFNEEKKEKKQKHKGKRFK